MKLAISLFILIFGSLLGLQQSVIAQSEVRISGVVREGETDQPLAGVLVSAGLKTAVTDALGNYSIEGLTPGKYRVAPERIGYAYLRAARLEAPVEPGVWVQISPGQANTSVDLRMIRGGTISGRVLTLGGQPATGVTTTLSRFAYDDFGNRRLLLAKGTPLKNTSVEVDDRGQFRFFGLQSGEYILSASSGGNLFGSIATVFYPDTSDEEQSVPVNVRAGEQVVLAPMTVRPIKRREGVRLRLTGESLPARANAQLGIGISGSFYFSSSNGVRDVLELPPMAEGKYDVLLSWDTLGGPLYHGNAILDVTDSDVSQDILITVSGAAKVTGKIAMVDASGTPASFKVTDVLCMVRPVFSPARTGSCTKSSVLPGLYRLDLTRMPVDAYVLSARAGDKDLMSGPFEIKSDVDIDIVLAKLGSVIAGTVTDANGDRISDAVVSLVPEVQLRKSGFLYRSTVTDPDGRFELRGVRPGSYRLYAWSELEGPAFLNADFMKEYEDRGTSVQIENIGHLALDLRVIENKKASQN